ncbi:MAG TPA: hypothetical protein VF923_00350 [Gemmatimonadales bacterium]
MTRYARCPLALAAVLALVVPPLTAQVDTAAGAAALADFATACAKDGGALWGRSLCGPLYLVDPASRSVIANQPDSAHQLTAHGAVYVGTLPAGVTPANTAVTWGGVRWAMVMLPLPADRFTQLELLAHESFHRIQGGLGVSVADASSPHLDERDGRVWLRLELRALSRALSSSGPAARDAARDAMLFRAYRVSQTRGADSLEALLETQEGLAEYTGAKVALAAVGLPDKRLATELADYEARPSYVRSFAYATGPAIGLLLDRYASNWRARVRTRHDPAGLLAAALGFHADDGLEREAKTAARAYDGAAIMTAEDARASDRATRLAAYRARLVDGPVLVLKQRDLGFTMDPNTLVPLGPAGTVYPTGTFKASWGTLQVSGGGALVSPDFTSVAVAAPADTSGQTLTGSGWTLALASGWVVRRSAAHAGSYEVVASQ